MSAALWAINMGRSVALVEKAETLGGLQRNNFHPNIWLPGFVGEIGHRIANKFSDETSNLKNLSIYAQSEVNKITRSGETFLLDLFDHKNQSTLLMQSRYLVLATGTRASAPDHIRKLAEQNDRIIIGPEGDKIIQGICNSNVLILGGGDNAVEHALFLLDKNNAISIVARSFNRARKDMLRNLHTNPAVKKYLSPTFELRNIQGKIQLVIPNSGVCELFDYCLLMYGFVPNAEVLTKFTGAEPPELDSDGFIKVDAKQRTSVHHVYAVGDITNSQHPCVATAVAQGIVAARDLVYS